MDLTSSQQKALDLKRNIAVTASAGSGKTSVLVERYMRILEQERNAGVENILAITFTNKAAAEMRRRVREAVIERIEHRPSEEARWVEVRDSLPSAHISTIHAFCSSVLRQRPVEAGVDPQFEMLDDADRSALVGQAVDAALEALAAGSTQIAASPKNAASCVLQTAALRELLSHFGRHRLHAILGDLINRRDVVLACFDSIRGKDGDEIVEWMAERLEQYRGLVIRDFAADRRVQGLIHELRALAPRGAGELDPSVKPNEARLKVIESWDALQADRDLDRRLERLADMQDFNLRGGSKKQWDEHVLARCKEALKEIKTRAADAAKKCPALSGADRSAAGLLRALAAVYESSLAAYREAKGLGAQLDYSDLEEMTLELLSNDRGAAREQCRNQFAFVLVDEFQDINERQWQIIEQLVAGDRHKLFVVGDPKQSIYAFRGAEVEVFSQVKEAAVVAANRSRELDRVGFDHDRGRERERLGDITMADNFRSRQAVADFINALFESVMGHADEKWDPPYERLQARSSDEEDGRVELLLLPARADDEADDEPVDATIGSAEQEARLLAGRLHALVKRERFMVFDKQAKEHRPADFHDIVILLRSRRKKVVACIEDALRAYDIPFEVVEGVGFYERQEVRDLTNVLRFLAAPRNDIALAGALRSPVFGVSDAALFLLSQADRGHLIDGLRAAASGHVGQRPELRRGLGDEAEAVDFAYETLTRWQRAAHRLPGSELIRRIVEGTGLCGVVGSGPRGEQDLANLEKLILKAQEFHVRGLASLADLAERLDQLMDLAAREGEAALRTGKRGVRVMTVHAAKGLEAPIVAVADLAAGFNFGTQRSIYFDREWGLGLKAPNPDEGYQTQTTALREAIKDVCRRKTIAEEKRLFYVACTRARDMLLLCGSFPQGRQQSYARWLTEAFGLEPDSESLTWADEGREHETPIFRSADAFDAPAEPAPGEPAYVAAEDLLRRRDLDAGTTAYAAVRDALAPLPTSDAARRLSPTELMLFEQCPWRHYFCYELGIPDETAAFDEAEAVRSHNDARATAIARGTAAHRMFERLSPDAPEQDMDMARAVLNELEGRTGEEREAWADDLFEMARTFRASEFGAQVFATPECRNEASFSLKLSRGRIEGQIDKLYRNPAGAWAILDYKTNAISAPQKESTAHKYELQMQVYAFAACRLLSEPVSEIDAHLYFTALNDTFTFHFGERELAGIERRLEEMVAEVAAFDPSPEPRRRASCDGCAYLDTGVCRI